MAKELVSEPRNDFRGGLNVYLSPDLLADNELTNTDNARIDTNGPIAKRLGTRRMHSAALAASTAIKGIVQWDGPSGSQIVAICNGDLFYRNQSSGEYAAFTQVDPGTTDAFSTTEPAIFSALRGTESGAALKLYIASGGKYYEWSGTTLIRLDMGSTATAGIYCPDAEVLDTYHLRIFTNSSTKPQNLVWSRIGDGRNFKAGLSGDGGTAMISAIQADDIVSIKTIGRSLLVFTHKSIARFAGYSAGDIQVDQDTEGLSPEVGIVGPQALHRLEHLIFFISEKGAYIASEGAIAPVGLKVQPIFDAMDRTLLEKIVVGHHHGRSEIWVAYSGPSDSGLNKSVLVYNLRHQAWYGPFSYSFGITSFEHYEDPNGDEFIIAGCSDGFVRHLDIGTKDDVLSDGSGGSSFGWNTTLAPFFFGNPEITHAVRYFFTQAVVAAANDLGYTFSVQSGPGTSSGIVVGTGNPNVADGSKVKSYKTYPESRFAIGQRFILSFGSNGIAPDAQPKVHGVVVYAHRMDRVI